MYINSSPTHYIQSPKFTSPSTANCNRRVVFPPIAFLLATTNTMGDTAAADPFSFDLPSGSFPTRGYQNLLASDTSKSYANSPIFRDSSEMPSDLFTQENTLTSPIARQNALGLPFNPLGILGGNSFDGNSRQRVRMSRSWFLYTEIWFTAQCT